MTTLYLSGDQAKGSDQNGVICPLTSSVVLFMAEYCRTEINIVFVADQSCGPDNAVCTHQTKHLSEFTVSFSSLKDLPVLVKNVSLPCVHQPGLQLVRSGLCVVLRHLIQDAHLKHPTLDLIDLLGFRQGSMKMCAEVSSWTKLCEVDIPIKVTQLIASLRHMKSHDHSTQGNQTVLPKELITLEKHFQVKRKVHNDNKRMRAAVVDFKESFTKCLDKDASDVSTVDVLLNRLNTLSTTTDGAALTPDLPSQPSHQLPLPMSCVNQLCFDQNQLIIEKTINLSHGVRKFKVDKKSNRPTKSINKVKEDNNRITLNNSNSNNSQACDDSIKDESQSEDTSCGKELSTNSSFDLSALKDAVMDLTFTDIDFEHTYSEGIELTIADLILITYHYHLLVSLHNNTGSSNLSSQLPHVMRWVSHMVSLPKVMAAGQGLGWDWGLLKTVCHQQSTSDDLDPKGDHLTFVMEQEEGNAETEELSRCAKQKHKALKPDVLQALDKFETVGISPLVGSHPKGDKVKVDWDAMPSGVHPKQGHVPVKRTERKCQQLENLATAVETVVKAGDIIVDFCSGGGHLGILCAYLFPTCQVYLVENKEESLLKSSARLESLGLHNVTLYQCNMDYFIGRFNVGLCLHACGSATDMVLELCTRSHASFVICPCCYGGIHNTHLLTYPRSQRYTQAEITYTDFLTMGHAADQTEFDIKLEKQGRVCMNLVDTDRAEYAKQQGYKVTLCHLQPLTCSPKNNLLIGTPPITCP